MDAIHDYIDVDTYFADYFTVSDSGDMSIEMKNIEAFIEDSQNLGIFTQTDETGNFYLAESVDSLEDFSDGLGITPAVTLAMLTAFQKYDASWGDIIADLTGATG